MAVSALLHGPLAVSDSFGLLPLPITRLIGNPLREYDKYMVPTDPAEATQCEVCQ